MADENGSVIEQGQLWRDSMFPLFGCLKVIEVRDDEVVVLETDASVYVDKELTLDRDRFENRIADGELYLDGTSNPKVNP